MPQSQQDKENQDSWDRFISARNAAFGTNRQDKNWPSTLEVFAYPIGFALVFFLLGVVLSMMSRGFPFPIPFLVIGIFVGRSVLKRKYAKKSQN